MKNIFKTVKRFAAGIVALTIISAGAVFATDANTLSINGQVIEDAQVIKVEDKVFVPVRALCEGLRMEVQWDNETEMVTISKLPVYVTFSPEADGYTFARTAPIRLGSAPFLKNDRTYVPVNFIDEILQQKYSITEKGDVNVTAEIDNSVGAIVVERQVDGENISITVKDSKYGEVVVNLTPETVITDEEGKALTPDVLVENAEIRIEYADFMTMSIPPMTNAVKIKFLGVIEAEKENIAVLEKDEEAKTIKVFDKEMNMEIILNVSDKTVITDAEGNALGFDAIKKGTELGEVQHEEAMTKSLPPITNATKLVIAK